MAYLMAVWLQPWLAEGAAMLFCIVLKTRFPNARGQNAVKKPSEAVVTSTTKGILPVTAINDVAVGAGTPGPLTRQLAEALRFEEPGTKGT